MTEMTKEQREALSWAADRAHVASLGKPIDGFEGQRWRVLKDLLAAHSTEQRMSDAAPEGCTPADARKLREANHRLADENHRQARTIAFLRDQNRRIIEAADRIRDGAACAADDAARYRWLRRQAVEVKSYASGNPSWEIDWALRGESFEAAVDTARKAEIERIDRGGNTQ